MESDYIIVSFYMEKKNFNSEKHPVLKVYEADKHRKGPVFNSIELSIKPN